MESLSWRNNPADDGTLGIPFRDFHSHTPRFQGPEFLKLPGSQWPLNPVHPQLTAMRCTRRNSKKNGFHTNGDATDVANDDATDVVNDDAPDVANVYAVATKEYIAYGATEDKTADVTEKTEYPHTKCLRTAEVATHNLGTAAVLEEKIPEAVGGEAEQRTTATEVAVEY